VPVTWQPSSLSSLQAWYDAQALTEVDGDDIDTFSDQSGNGFDAPWENSRPDMSTTGIDGYKSVTFDVSRRERFTLPASLMSGATEACYFAVARRIADPAPNVSSAGPIIHLSGDNQNFGGNWGYTNGMIDENFGTSARKSVNPTPTLTSTRLYSAHSAPSDYRMYLDGTSILSSASNTVEFDRPSRWIGHFVYLSTIYTFAGYIAEILIFDSALTTTERERVEGYLAHKYALTANLPSDHPYKSGPPF
jgi:hypothetical protein